jgi:hypothetical protein
VVHEPAWRKGQSAVGQADSGLLYHPQGKEGGTKESQVKKERLVPFTPTMMTYEEMVRSGTSFTPTMMTYFEARSGQRSWKSRTLMDHTSLFIVFCLIGFCVPCGGEGLLH